MKHAIKITLQIIISALVAIEVSYPPNHYKEELLLALVLYICLKHDIPEKILSTIDKVTAYIKRGL